MLELHRFDLDAIATALSDQNDYEHQWLVDPASGELVLWTSDTGIDGQNPIDFDELDEKLVAISPLPASVWYRDRADFADAVTDETARSALRRALDGRGAFRRFKNELYENHPDLISAWHAFRDARAAFLGFHDLAATRASGGAVHCSYRYAASAQGRPHGHLALLVSSIERVRSRLATPGPMVHLVRRPRAPLRNLRTPVLPLMLVLPWAA